MSTRTIKLIAGGLAIAGTITLAFMLVAALNSDNGKGPKLASVNVANLAPGRYMTMNTDAIRFFVIRPLVGEIYVIAVPTDGPVVPMPETHWWSPIIKCRDFGVDAEGFSVRSESRFRCRDAGQPEEWAKRWQWDIRGRHIPDAKDSPLDDMYRVRIERSDDDIIFTGIDSD